MHILCIHVYKLRYHMCTSIIIRVRTSSSYNQVPGYQINKLFPVQQVFIAYLLFYIIYYINIYIYYIIIIVVLVLIGSF